LSMSILHREKEFYTEQEAAQELGMSVDRLHFLLDSNIFNDGSEKPAQLCFRAKDLIVIGFWDRSTGDSKVVRMPRISRH
jgi:hypothetical protein